MYNYTIPYREKHSSVNRKETIQVTGSYTVRIEPDTAIAYIGVVTSDQELTVAQHDNSVIAQKILHSLYSNGIKEKNIQTSTYQIYPQYDYVEGKQLFKGYEVRQVFQVQMNDLSQVGRVIDDSVKSGANVVERIEFSLTDSRAPYLKALAKAYESAFEKAKILATTSGGTLDPSPLNIIEIQEFRSRIPSGKVLAYSTEASSPIASGQIGVTANIQVEYLKT
ncbi:SIMPL domain-containing protein [Bacillus spongiae]|uniref:SIMPL domain-containing protein n=1 Tax=Bacillus spongiae TaxID=2683610 RepID=A0ABU8HAN3_9BACI